MKRYLIELEKVERFTHQITIESDLDYQEIGQLIDDALVDTGLNGDVEDFAYNLSDFVTIIGGDYEGCYEGSELEATDFTELD